MLSKTQHKGENMATITSDNGRHYEFVENCGGGGFGKVSKVRCVEDGKIYAFKFFPPPKDNDLDTQNAQKNIRKNFLLNFHLL